MRCATHRSVETELACGKCGKPICPRCLVHTPVGARCRQCANLRRLPMYHISLGHMLRGAAASLATGAVLGALWGVVLPFGTPFFYGLLIGLGLGYGVGEAVSVATNRKAGPPLQAVAAVGVAVAYLARAAVLASALKDVSIRDIATADVLGYLVVLLAVVIAMGRVR